MQHGVYLGDSKDVCALMILNEVGHGVHDGAHAEAEQPGEDDHPPTTAAPHDHVVPHHNYVLSSSSSHDHSVPHSLVNTQVPVNGQHHWQIMFFVTIEHSQNLPSDMRAAPMAHVQSPWTALHVRERATWSVSAPRPPWMVTYHHHYHHHHHHRGW